MLIRCMFVWNRTAYQLSCQASSSALRSIWDQKCLQSSWTLRESGRLSSAQSSPLIQFAAQPRSLSTAPARHLRSRRFAHGDECSCCCVGDRRIHSTPPRKAGAVLLRSSRSEVFNAAQDSSQAHSSTADAVSHPTVPLAADHRRPEESSVQEGSEGPSTLLHERLWTPQHGGSSERSAASAVTADEGQLRLAQRVVWTEAFAREAGGAAPLQTVRLHVDGREVAVLPLWIAVHQPVDGGPARVHESTCAVDEAMVAQLTEPLHCFGTAEGLAFSESDRRHGAWRNYFVGIVGAVAADENDVLWPNQVLHRDRVMWNLRSTDDLVRFLADPTSAGIHEHCENLRRLQVERDYHKGWSWHHLRDRWGERSLAAANVFERDFF